MTMRQYNHNNIKRSGKIKYKPVRIIALLPTQKVPVDQARFDGNIAQACPVKVRGKIHQCSGTRERIAAATAQYNGQSGPEDIARERKTCAVDAHRIEEKMQQQPPPLPRGLPRDTSEPGRN